jgi:hypothetical protein
MRKLALGLVAAGAVFAATAAPAMAQVGVYAGPGGIGVGVGPVGVGVGPGPYNGGPYYDGYYDYAGPGAYVGPGWYDGQHRWHRGDHRR